MDERDAVVFFIGSERESNLILLGSCKRRLVHDSRMYRIYFVTAAIVIQSINRIYRLFDQMCAKSVYVGLLARIPSVDPHLCG